MGFPVTLSMNLGMFVGWALLSPLSKHMGWAPGPVGSNTDGARGWIVSIYVSNPFIGLTPKLWVALAIMIAESLTSLFPILISTVTRQISHGRLGKQSNRDYLESSDPDDEDVDDVEHEPAHRLVPSSWIILGLGASGVLGVVLVWIVFGKDGIHPWATAVGLVLASGLAVVGVRALGETDINPVSTKGSG